ncbi:V-type ATPase subunit, partial [Candidatus Bathyarchaeota archaeon]|nr:V-type ATPase subunit [Candidatus Bathyarchaeota archaeon]
KDIRQFIIGLGEPYTEILSPIYEEDVSFVRSRLRQQIYRTMKRGRSMNDFGFNVIMAYLVFCEIEKDDLVGMSWSKAQGISPENILKYLVIPHFI